MLLGVVVRNTTIVTDVDVVGAGAAGLGGSSSLGGLVSSSSHSSGGGSGCRSSLGSSGAGAEVVVLPGLENTINDSANDVAALLGVQVLVVLLVQVLVAVALGVRLGGFTLARGRGRRVDGNLRKLEGTSEVHGQLPLY